MPFERLTAGSLVARLDQNADNKINLLDLGAQAAKFGHSVNECP